MARRHANVPVALIAAALLASSAVRLNAADLDIQQTGVEVRDAARIRDITFANTQGKRTAAYLVEPALNPSRHGGPGILFVHWYEPESKDSNRTQYLREAVPLAKQGVVSLLIETMWSDPKWFPRRDSSKDFENSEQQIAELARALDLLESHPLVDPKRLAYVGHDFGAMYGAVLASRDKRVKAWALQAGTASFSDWFLYSPKRTGADRDAFVARLAPLDPVKHIRHATPLLLQFGKGDPHVPDAKAQAIAGAAVEPKQVRWYPGGHALDAQAVTDRLEWLRTTLRLQP